MMTANELREAFLSFFEEHGHVRRPSDSLVPTHDPSLLFTGAGMNQFKDSFLSRGDPKLKRAATCQKCLRTGDIDRVGRTPGHHTFFEMLGNFSFGDYFKKEAIHWGWELVTKVFRLDPGALRVSVYEEDDEAYDIWEKVIGIRRDWIYRFNAKENFWPSNAPEDGPNGPCGPCSEIFFDHGEKVGCGKSTCDPSCSCGRYVEFYNLVFTQFDRKEDGSLKPLPGRNVDTGMGLERTLAVLHGAPNNFETELFLPLLDRIGEISGRKYRTAGEEAWRMRRITDHIRAIAFCIADGVLPSNEGRGYVERRLLRVATIDGRALGIDHSFLYQLVPVISSIMGKPYPEVAERRETIARIVKAEEEKFADTLDNADRIIHESEYTRTIASEAEYAIGSDKYLPGEELFRLYDTYGMPPEVVAEKLNVTEQSMREFEELMEKQRDRGRSRSKISKEIFVGGSIGKLRETVPATEFAGYRETTTTGPRVLAIIRGDELVERASKHDGTIFIVLDKTPFYPEQGGQTGDTGFLWSAGTSFEVTDTQLSPPHILHKGTIRADVIRTGDQLERAVVDEQRRKDIQRNHTATHLLHAALRQTLGEHAEQSGSLVAPDYLRFDFHHFEAPGRRELETIERIVNEKIIEDLRVECEEMDLDAARKTGAKALFGEKYGDRVRVIRAGTFSKELCGGIHCERTGEIGQFKIISEESVAAGIRRITAVTGRFALDYWTDVERRLREVASELNTSLPEVVQRAKAVVRELKELRRELESSRTRQRSEQITDLLSTAESVEGVKIVIAEVPGLTVDELRSAVDVIKNTHEEAVAVLASVTGDKVAFIAYAGKRAREKGIDAGKLVKEVAKVVGGGGGGREELAQAGGTDIAKTNEALELARKLLAGKLGPG